MTPVKRWQRQQQRHWNQVQVNCNWIGLFSPPLLETYEQSIQHFNSIKLLLLLLLLLQHIGQQCLLLTVGGREKEEKRKRQNLLKRPFSISKTFLQQSIVLTFPFFPFSLLVYLNHSLFFFFLFLLITIPFACCTVCWHCLLSFFFSSLFRRRTVSHSTTVSFIGSFSHCFSFWPCYSFSFFCISLPAINRKVYR